MFVNQSVLSDGDDAQPEASVSPPHHDDEGGLVPAQVMVWPLGPIGSAVMMSMSLAEAQRLVDVVSARIREAEALFGPG